MENVSHLKICPFCNCENQTEEKSHKTLSHSFQSLLYADSPSQSPWILFSAKPLEFWLTFMRAVPHIPLSLPSLPTRPSSVFMTHVSEGGRERGEASRRPRPHRRCASERAHKKFHHFNYFPCLPPFPFPS